MRLPYFASAEGREEVKKANRTLSRSQLRLGLGVNSERKQEQLNAQRIIQRDKLQKILTAAFTGVAVTLGAIGIGFGVSGASKEGEKQETVLPKEDTPKTPTPVPIQESWPSQVEEKVVESVQEPPTLESTENHERGQKLLAATRELEKTGLCTVEWVHPEGHEGDIPTEDGLIIISNVHADPNDIEILGREKIVSMFHDFQILLNLEEAGMKNFHFEGSSAAEKISPIHLQDENGVAIRKDEFKELLQYLDFWLNDIRSNLEREDDVAVERLFTTVSKEGVSSVGSENPETYEEWKALMERARKAAQAAAPFVGKSPFNRDRGEFFIIREDHPDGGFYVPHERYFAVWQEYIDASNAVNAVALGPREQYIAEHVFGDVVVMGGGHSNNFMEKLPASGRSVCICKTQLFQEYEKRYSGADANAILNVEDTERAIQERKETVERWKQSQLQYLQLPPLED